MLIKFKQTSVIVEQLGLGDKAQYYFTNICQKKIDKHIPKDKGNLRKVVTIGKNYIRYKMPYAKYQYYGVREDGSHQVKEYTTAGTGPYWDKRMYSVERDSIRKEMQERYGKK